MKLIITNLFILALSLSSFGQIEQTDRFEINGKPGKNYVNVVSAGEFGLVVFQENKERADNGNILWEVIMLNTSLEERWKRNYEVNRRNYFKGYEYKSNNLYLLFRKGPILKTDYLILKINLTEGDVAEFNFPNEIDLELEDFRVVGNSAVFAGYSNYMPVIFNYSFENKSKVAFPGLFATDMYIMELDIDDFNNNINVLLTKKEMLDDKKIEILTFDESGNLIRESSFGVKDGYEVYSGKITDFGDEKIAITGTFGNPHSELAEGLYFTRVKKGEKPQTKYYNFSELNNFFNYLPEKREKKIKEKIKTRRSRGKNIKIRSRIILHELIEEKGEYIMLGEMYEHSFGNYVADAGIPYWENSFNYGSRGYISNNLDDLDETAFHYKQALVLGFDINGNLKWDNSIPLEDVVTPFLDQVVNISTVHNRIILIYKDDNELHSKVVNKGDVIEDHLVDKIKLSNSNDDLKRNHNLGGLNYWYEDHFYAWGYQKIINKKTDLKKKRDVFYINKISIK